MNLLTPQILFMASGGGIGRCGDGCGDKNLGLAGCVGGVKPELFLPVKQGMIVSAEAQLVFQGRS